MITPRDTRLVRVPGLSTLHDVVALLARRATPDAARRVAVVVPTTSAVERLRRTLEHLWFDDAVWPSPTICATLGVAAPPRRTACVPPRILTRGGLYEALRTSLPDAPGALTRVAREVLLSSAAAEAANAGVVPPFPVRPGLIAEMLALYDDLLRQHRTVDDFERVLVGALDASADLDRGAARLLEQTHFIVAVFRAYERRRLGESLVDEHVVRARWLTSPDLVGPFDHVIVTVADTAAESGGLWVTDFDLLTRIGGLGRLDIVATDAMLATGLDERLVELLPGLDLLRVAVDEPQPVLVAPVGEPARAYALLRDREDEVRAIVRRVKAAVASGVGPEARLDQTAIVYDRPLPYVYLAQQAFASARVGFEADDALPLAAEPFAAACDLVPAAVLARCTRATLVALLGSPHFVFAHEGEEVDGADVLALDHALAEAGVAGGAQSLARVAEAWREAPPEPPRWQRRGRPALAAAVAARLAEQLSTLARDDGIAAHVERWLALLDAHLRPVDPDDARTARARAAVRATLAELGHAVAAHGDRVTGFEDVVSIVRRALEAQTFTPKLGEGGVQVLDAQAARYGRFHRVHLVGLVEGEWLSTGSPSVLYPMSLLRELGWPQDTARQAAKRAAFRDLLALATGETHVSAFHLEDDAVVRPSPLVEELDAAGLALVREADEAMPLVFTDEGLWSEPAEAWPGSTTARWLALRARRPDLTRPAFRGTVGAWAPGRLRVTAVETYLQCPFKYFAAHVLGLEHPPGDDALLSPRARGDLVHRVFERFFTRWQAAGEGAIRVESIDRARAMFTEVVDAVIEGLGPPEAVVERDRLLGSAVAPGLGDRAFAFEASRAVDVVARRLEARFDGVFRIGDDASARDVRLSGTADRVDLLADGTLRIVDYKIGRAPRRSMAVQLPIYGFCAEQALDGTRGRRWRVAEAGYLAFGEPVAWTPVVGDASDRDSVLADGAARFLAAVDGITRGEFPPRPAEARLCTMCAFAAVCRKEFVDVDE